MYKKCEEILKELESEGKLKVWWNFKFPEKEELKLKLEDMLEDKVEKKYYLLEYNLKFKENLPGAYGRKFGSKGKIEKDICSTLQAAMRTGGGNVPLIKEQTKCIQVGKLDIKGRDNIKRVYSPKGISPTIDTMQGGNRQPKILNNEKIRKLTPLECWRLMGFDDKDFYKAQETGNSNSQLYKQARK